VYTVGWLFITFVLHPKNTLFQWDSTFRESHDESFELERSPLAIFLLAAMSARGMVGTYFPEIELDICAFPPSYVECRVFPFVLTLHS